MERRIKSLFHRKNPKGSSNCASSGSNIECPVQPLSYDDSSSGRSPYQGGTPLQDGRGGSPSQVRGQKSKYSQNPSTLETTSRTNGTLQQGKSSMASSQRSGHGPGTTVSLYQHPACLPSLRTGSGLSNDSEHMSLGGDPRLAKDGGRKRYNEDVADRNLAQYCHGGSPYTSVDSGEKYYTAESVGKEETKANKGAPYPDTTNEYEGTILHAPYLGTFQPPRYQVQMAQWDQTPLLGIPKLPTGERPTLSSAPSSDSSSNHDHDRSARLNATAFLAPYEDPSRLNPKLADDQQELDGAHDQRSYIAKGQDEPPSLNGAIDLSNPSTVLEGSLLTHSKAMRGTERDTPLPRALSASKQSGYIPRLLQTRAT